MPSDYGSALLAATGNITFTQNANTTFAGNFLKFGLTGRRFIFTIPDPSFKSYAGVSFSALDLSAKTILIKVSRVQTSGTIASGGFFVRDSASVIAYWSNAYVLSAFNNHGIFGVFTMSLDQAPTGEEGGSIDLTQITQVGFWWQTVSGSWEPWSGGIYLAESLTTGGSTGQGTISDIRVAQDLTPASGVTDTPQQIYGAGFSHYMSHIGPCFIGNNDATWFNTADPGSLIFPANLSNLILSDNARKVVFNTTQTQTIEGKAFVGGSSALLTFENISSGTLTFSRCTWSICLNVGLGSTAIISTGFFQDAGTITGGASFSRSSFAGTTADWVVEWNGAATFELCQFEGTPDHYINFDGVNFADGATIDLSSVTFGTPGTNLFRLDATGKTLNILVSAESGITSADVTVVAGTVNIIAPISEIVLTGIPAVAGALVGVLNLSTLVPSFPVVSAGTVTIPTDPATNYLIAVDAPGYQLQRVVLAGETPSFEVSLENNRDLYEAGTDISDYLLFNYSTFEVTFLYDPLVEFNFANIYRTIEDYLATTSGVFFPNPPRPIRVPGRNFLFFPYDQVADEVNPVRVRPAPENTGNPRITDVVVILEGAEHPQTDIFDFSLAGGNVIFYQTDATVSTVMVSGGLSSEDRAVLTTITNQTAPIADLAETLEAPGIFSAEALANAPATGGGTGLGPEDIERLERIEQQLIADEKKGASRYQRFLPGTATVILDKDVVFDPVEGFTITEHEEPPP